MVDDSAVDCVAAQKLPKPWVGYTLVSSGSSAASRCAEAYWACTSSPVLAGPSRSGRPVEPNNSEPPVNTAGAWPGAWSTYARWVKV